MWTQILLSSCACFLRPQLYTNLKKYLINCWRIQETPPLLYDLSNSLIEDTEVDEVNINLEDKQNIHAFLVLNFFLFFYWITLNITPIFNLHLCFPTSFIFWSIRSCGRVFWRAGITSCYIVVIHYVASLPFDYEWSSLLICMSWQKSTILLQVWSASSELCIWRSTDIINL